VTSTSTQYVLPIEILWRILEQLNYDDFVQLCLSGVFVSQLQTQPWFFMFIRRLIFHAILSEIFSHKLVQHGIFFSLVYKSDIYFVIDQYKHAYFTKKWTPFRTVLSFCKSFNLIHQFCNMIAASPNYFAKDTINSLRPIFCSSTCVCWTYNHHHLSFSNPCFLCSHHFTDISFQNNASRFPFWPPHDRIL